MKRANIYYKEILAGVLAEGDDGYEFHYLPEYLASNEARPVSLTMPLRKEVYRRNRATICYYRQFNRPSPSQTVPLVCTILWINA